MGSVGTECLVLLLEGRNRKDPLFLQVKQATRAHARSGDAVAIACYLGSGKTLDEALAGFANSYADQNERDYAAFMRRFAEDGSKLWAS
jgi:hypothetical protein